MKGEIARPRKEKRRYFEKKMFFLITKRAQSTCYFEAESKRYYRIWKEATLVAGKRFPSRRGEGEEILSQKNKRRTRHTLGSTQQKVNVGMSIHPLPGSGGRRETLSSFKEGRKREKKRSSSENRFTFRSGEKEEKEEEHARKRRGRKKVQSKLLKNPLSPVQGEKRIKNTQPDKSRPREENLAS